MPTRYKNIDAYLATLKASQRAPLERLRKTIRSIVPKSVECISYGMPAFRVDGAVVAGFRATAKGYSYYPFSGATLQSLATDLEDYDRTKSALHFTAEEPLPTTLVRKLIRVRIAEVVASATSRAPRGQARRALGARTA